VNIGTIGGCDTVDFAVGVLFGGGFVWVNICFEL
jgi:hypothetical protein